MSDRSELEPIFARIDAAFSHEAHDAERDALYELYRWVEKRFPTLEQSRARGDATG